MQGPTYAGFNFAKIPCLAVPDTPRTQHKGWEVDMHKMLQKPPVPALRTSNLHAGITEAQAQLISWLA